MVNNKSLIKDGFEQQLKNSIETELINSKIKYLRIVEREKIKNIIQFL